MGELLFYYVAGLTLIPALLAFAGTFFDKGGGRRAPVTASRRLLSLLIIYVVCVISDLAMTLMIVWAAVPDQKAYESPFLIIAGLLGYFAGKWFLTRPP